MELPSGTVTFFFTDIQGSTKLWDDHPEAMRLALARHDALLRQAIEDNNGVVFKTIGDAFCAAFATAPDALRAALFAQLALRTEVWSEPITIKVRMALHTGAAEVRDNDYFGPPLNRAARLLATGHGEQVLLSDVAHDLTQDTLPPAVAFKSMGEHRLRDLGRPEHVYQLLHPALPADFAPLKSLDNPELPNNLPLQVTSFIGREKEILEIKSLLAKTRLLTLKGSGGSGKTRLALQVAAEVLEHFSEGVWLVELAALVNPDLLASTVAQTLGIAEQPGHTIQKTLFDSLKGRTLLLILDNCEHLLSACAQLVAALLRCCPHVKLLTTSREGLGIGGEQSYRVPSLTAPNLKQKSTPQSLSQYEAVQLFIERACFHKPDFVVTNANAPSLAQLCHRLDGIPLAIELAAARVRSLPVEEINIRLDNRFRLLTGGDRAALPRQQTLRALIDWSYDLLSVQEKRLLERLYVFVGGWTLVAAEQVGAGESATGETMEEWEVFDLLTSLADKSLVLTEERGGAARYRMLETVRQYGRDRLVESGESEEVQTRHRDFFLAFVEEAEPKLLGAEQGAWLERLEAEHENLRSALDWSLEEKHAEEALRLCGAPWRFWVMRGYFWEGREWFGRTLEAAGAHERTPERAKALHGAGNLARGQGDYASARACYEESLTIQRQLGDRSGTADSLIGLGIVFSSQGDYDSARSFYEESLKIHREIENRSGIADSFNCLGNLSSSQCDYGSARSFHNESLTIQREIENRSGIASSLNNLGNVSYYQGDYDSARSFYEESLTIQRELGNRRSIANSLIGLGIVFSSQGDYDSAQSFYEESLTIQRELGDRSGIADSLIGLGIVFSSHGDYGSARSCYEESLTIQRELGDRSGIAGSLNNLGIVSYHQGDYNSSRSCYEESLTIQRELGDRRGIAGSLNNLGNLSYYQGDYDSARSFYEESMTIQRELGDRRGIAGSLEAFARLAAKNSRAEQAAALWGAAEALREQIGTPLAPDKRETYLQEVAQARQALGEEAFSAAWAAGATMTLVQAMNHALQRLEPARDS